MTQRRVSIPFKREGLSELTGFSTDRVLVCVSIPFKREGLSELTLPENWMPVSLKFQFPSNGKVFPNLRLVAYHRSVIMGFNSLQTGRSFRTRNILY